MVFQRNERCHEMENSQFLSASDSGMTPFDSNSTECMWIHAKRLHYWNSHAKMHWNHFIFSFTIKFFICKIIYFCHETIALFAKTISRERKISKINNACMICGYYAMRDICALVLVHTKCNHYGPLNACSIHTVRRLNGNCRRTPG